MSRALRPWYEEAFGPLYTEVYRHRSAEQAERELDDFLATCEIPAGSRVLDLACGEGRHLRAMRRRGLQTAGLDLSAHLLLRARTEGSGPLVRADMRRLPFASEGFQAVTSFFTSFGYFEREGEDRQVLQEVARVLAPGGWFLLDFLDAESVERKLVPESVRQEGAREIRERRSLRGGRVEKEVVILDDRGNELSRYVESVRLYRRDDLKALAQDAGLDPRSWKDRLGNEEGPPRCVMLARRDP